MSAAALAAVVWTYWKPRDPVLSGALLVTATFLFSPYTLNYDFVVLAWVLALLRQRPGLVQRDHAVILVVWSLPVTMMIAGLAHIPLGFLALVGVRRPGFCARSPGSEPVPPPGAGTRSAGASRPVPANQFTALAIS